MQATGGRVKGMAASLQDVLREGRIGVSLPPFFLSLLLSPFHSLYRKLAAGRQMNAVWSEPTEVQGPAVQATKELHARHLLFSYQNTFSHVPAFPSLSPHSSSTTAPQHPFHQLRLSLFLSPHFSSTFFSRILLSPLLTPPTTPMDVHSCATIILLPTSSLAHWLYLNSVVLVDNPTVLPLFPKCTNPTWMITTRPEETADWILMSHAHTGKSKLSLPPW